MKKKNKTKRIVLISIYLLVLLYLATYGKIHIKNFLEDNHLINNKEETKNPYNYQENTLALFKEYKIEDSINEYSKTLEVAINGNNYNTEYLNEYLKINYNENDDFIENINALILQGYKSEEINNFYNKLNPTTIKDTILTLNYNENINKYLEYNFFKEEYLERYINYQNKNNYDVEQTITYVNIGIDNSFYTNVSNISNDDSHKIDVLVNKYHKLPDDFIPTNLKLIKGSCTKGGGAYVYMTEEASTAFEKMCEDAEAENLYIRASSGYRSIADQRYIYNNYVRDDGVANADTYSARPSYSEHNTGLALDFATGKLSYDVIEGSPEAAWVDNNSYKYGFIVRYPKNKTFITGYIYEPWHIRYLGIELATKIHEQNLTYEEYLAKQ